MNASHRVNLYKKIETKRGNPLIVYVTSQRRGANGSMAADVVDEFIQQIQLIPTGAKTIDLLIESTGGDGLVAWRIISLLRERVEKVNVLIPHSAFSAATMLALGGDEIVMGRYGCLGPIDPQITVRKKDGTTEMFAYEDIIAFLDFTKVDAGLTEQEYRDTAFKILCGTVEPITIGVAKRASGLAVSIGEKLLQTHMRAADEKIQATTIASKLNKSFFSHGHALSRKEAKEIGLNIIEPDGELEGLMWEVHESFNKELKTREPFDPIAEFLADPKAQPYITPPPAIQFPPQVNAQLLLQILEQHFQQQISVETPDVTAELKHAFAESARRCCEFFTQQKILVMRAADLSFVGSAVMLKSGWRDVTIEEETSPSQS